MYVCMYVYTVGDTKTFPSFFSLFSTAFYEACRFFVVRIFLKLLTVFVGRHRSFLLFLLVVFSLYLSAVSEAYCCFCRPSRKLLAILLAVFSLLSAVSEAFRRPSWKLIVVSVGRLGSFSLFCWLSFRCYRPSLKLFVGRLGSLLLFLSAVSEASCYFVGCLFAVIGRL